MKHDTGVTEMKKKSVVLLILLIIFGIITTTYAFNVTTVSTTAEFVDSPRSNSDREVSSYEAYPLGKNSIYVTITIASETADGTPDISVAVIPLDSNGDAIQSISGDIIRDSIRGAAWAQDTLYSTVQDIRWEYTETSFAELTVEVVFEKTGISTSFTDFMVEIQES